MAEEAQRFWVFPFFVYEQSFSALFYRSTQVFTFLFIQLNYLLLLEPLSFSAFGSLFRFVIFNEDLHFFTQG